MKHTPAIAIALLLLVGAGCNAGSNSAYMNPAGDAYGQSALMPPDADGVRANAQAFRERQGQPVNTTDEEGNAQAAVVPPGDVQGDAFPYDASGDASVQTGVEAETEVNEPTPQPSQHMEKPTQFPGVLPASELQNKQVRIETNKGTIVFDVYGEEGPKAASNFIALAMSGYYDGLTWHRVVPGFVIQGGDPQGTGTGGPGYKFEDDEVRLKYEEGTVAMANAGPDTNGSQFFICLEDQPSLPPSYSIFGKVTSGMEVVKSITKGDKMLKVTVENK